MNSISETNAAKQQYNTFTSRIMKRNLQCQMTALKIWLFQLLMLFMCI